LTVTTDQTKNKHCTCPKTKEDQLMGDHDMSIMVVQGGDQQQAEINAAAMQTEIIMDAAPPMWPNTMEALLQIDRRKKLLPAPSLRLPPHPAAALETTTTTTRGMGAGVYFNAENTFVDCNHFQDLLLEPSNNINKQQQHPQQQQGRSSDGRHGVLRELYSDKQAESLSFMQRELRVLNMQRLEAERELLLEDDYVSHEQQLPYNNKCTHLGNSNKAAAEEEEHEPLSSRDVCSCEEEEEEEEEDAAAAGGRGGAWNLSDSRCMETADEEGRRWADEYWRERARALAKLLSESIKREAALSAKLSGCTCVPMGPNSPKPAHLQQQQQQQQQQHPPPPPPPPPPHHHHHHLHHHHQQQQHPNNNNNSSSHQHQHQHQHINNNISSQQEQSSRVEALNYCCDSYLRFALRNAPVVVSHQVRTHKLFKPLSEFNSKSIILQPISIAHLLTCSLNSISN
jgi:hypothetical protein